MQASHCIFDAGGACCSRMKSEKSRPAQKKAAPLTYLWDLSLITQKSPTSVGLKSTDGLVSKRLQSSLQAYCLAYGIRLLKFHESLPEERARENELIAIAKDDIGIEGFTGFRNIRFYKNPDIDKEVIELSQGQMGTIA